MGLTRSSTGRALKKAADCADSAGVVALAGNPNVGKSTVFNALTGLHQHTGNWAGKTVSQAFGTCQIGGRRLTLVDLPGMYSLRTCSAEEDCAADLLADSCLLATVVICDATCLERTLFLALQIMEHTPRVVIGVNLMDEAKRKHIRPDLPLLARRLGVPVVGICARRGEGLAELTAAMQQQLDDPQPPAPPPSPRSAVIENALAGLMRTGLSRGQASRLLDGGAKPPDAETAARQKQAVEYCLARGVTPEELLDSEAAAITRRAEALCREALHGAEDLRTARDRRIDRIVTGKVTAVPLMLLLFCLLFWLTVSGANAPSALLSRLLFSAEPPLHGLCLSVGLPAAVADALVFGAYRVLSWVVAVMLPPMAIFFPLFTLMEDVGLLPRLAFNLDGVFQRARTCGKQALTHVHGVRLQRRGRDRAAASSTPRANAPSRSAPTALSPATAAIRC